MKNIFILLLTTLILNCQSNSFLNSKPESESEALDCIQPLSGYEVTIKYSKLANTKQSELKNEVKKDIAAAEICYKKFPYFGLFILGDVQSTACIALGGKDKSAAMAYCEGALSHYKKVIPEKFYGGFLVQNAYHELIQVYKSAGNKAKAKEYKEEAKKYHSMTWTNLEQSKKEWVEWELQREKDFNPSKKWADRSKEEQDLMLKNFFAEGN